MLTNSKLTVYHKSINYTTKEEEWIRYNYDNVWCFKSKAVSVNSGYTNMNDVQVRIPYDINENLNINNFAMGDIIVCQEIVVDITSQNDLNNYEFFNITSIKNNDFGNNPHIHLGGV